MSPLLLPLAHTRKREWSGWDRRRERKSLGEKVSKKIKRQNMPVLYNTYRSAIRFHGLCYR